jgi:phosphohistidine phosphatase SixA
MRMTIVRHALALDKKSWPGPDLERPLDPIGERQAAGMAPLLMKHKVRRIISSPALRCVQTMQPLADAANVPIELWDELGRDAAATRVLTAFTDPEYRDAVLCTHGEVLHQLLRADNVRRIARRGRLSPRRLLIKGSAWRLEITTSGLVSKLNHLRPIK